MLIIFKTEYHHLLDWGDKDIGGEGSNGASITSDPFISKSLEDDDIPF